MSKMIKLRELLNFTEQAPQPPTPGQPASIPPTAQPPPPPEPPTGEEPPVPDDPGEYDFTRDFKNFESTIEKTKQAAKKKFLDKMNQMVKDKKVTVNASRGYGQPQKDYTIDKVSKASVDWYYNKNIVVLTDGNGKEYFLTPGVNIKVEATAPAEPESTGQPADQAPKEPPKPAKPAAPANEPTSGGTPPTGQEPETASDTSALAPASAEKSTTKTPPATPPEENPLMKKKKKVAPPVEEELEEAVGDKPYDKETANKYFGPFFMNYIALRPGQSTLDLRPFFKGGKISGDSESWHSEARFEIPVELMIGLDAREFQLDYKNESYRYSGPGQPFSRGSVDVLKHGRFWVFEFYDSGGLDI
jgi:hypothetical protein